MGYAVGVGNGVAVSVCDGDEFAPDIIAVGGNDSAVGLHQLYYVALKIQDIVVGGRLCRSVGVEQGEGATVVGVDEVQNFCGGACTDGLSSYSAVLSNVVMYYAFCYLLSAAPFGIVALGNSNKVIHIFCENFL